MIMEPSPALKPLLEKVRNYITDAIIPLEQEYIDEIENGDRWRQSPRQKEILGRCLFASVVEPNQQHACQIGTQHSLV